MTSECPGLSPASRHDAVFQSTLWSQVRVAGQADAPGAREALESLCRLYWSPIYAFLRRTGSEREQARDWTQGFFAYLLEQRLLEKADPERGRFRSFLLGSLKFYVSNDRARQRAVKRGGGFEFVPLESKVDLGASAFSPADPVTATPERLFDQAWARAVLAEALRRLAEEHRRAGLGREFELLQPHLTGDTDEQLPALGLKLGRSAGATRVLICRLRNRFRRAVRAVIADTVSDLNQVELELRHLEECLRDG